MADLSRFIRFIIIKYLKISLTFLQVSGVSKFVQDVRWKLEGNFFFARKSFSLFKLVNAGFELRII
jgi:hypothetical protein